MAQKWKRRPRLPLVDGQLLLTGCEIEATMLAERRHRPSQAMACDLLADPSREDSLVQLYSAQVCRARALGWGAVLDTPTRGVSHDWVRRKGWGTEQIDSINRQAVFFTASLRSFFKTADMPILLNGVVAPRPKRDASLAPVSADEALAYHYRQVASLAAAGVDMVTGAGLTGVEEAIGIALAAKEVGVAVVLAFALGEGERLRTGEHVSEAIAQIDHETDQAPAYYEIELARPNQLDAAMRSAGDWARRVRGLRVGREQVGGRRRRPWVGSDLAALAQPCHDLLTAYPQISSLGGSWLADRAPAEQTSLFPVAMKVAAA